MKIEIYEKIVKPALDRGLSFCGLVLLSPLYAVISAAIFLDDPGPVFFVQKRVGKDKKFFKLHKFRTMKLSAPHDVPTHELQDPEMYITKVGQVLRRYSLDELPQLWDIFRGKMSIIGPRPALWNQKDLVACREQAGANSIMPGLTGWAQINGRDELEIDEKANYDGEYVKRLKQGGIRALFFDIRCFVGTIAAALGGDGVVEGGTGKLGAYTADTYEPGFEDYGFRKTFHIDKEAKKKILITGADSYIGNSLISYGRANYPNLVFDVIDMRNQCWEKFNFSGYDAVFHVAGIAHADVGSVSLEDQKKYYHVNTDLAIQAAEKSKRDGVKQFVFMSSMIIYGDSAPCGQCKIIDERTVPSPGNFYGDSKWQADKGVRKLQSGEFHVAVIRAPMIYGRGSKGNYGTLEKLARKSPIFPNIDNRRSMLYIDNLCEFVSLLLLSGEGGIYFPQNARYAKTADMAKAMAAAAGKRMRLVKAFNPAVMAASHIPGKIGGLIGKAFGSYVYSLKLSDYKGLDYQKVSFEQSIERTEGGPRACLKIHSRHLPAPLCGKFGPHSVNIDYYASLIRDKSPTNCAVHLTESNFQTRSQRGDGVEPAHILIISQYFYPETFRVNDMAAEWVKRGYKVTVVTGIPNYPMGKFFKGYGYGRRRTQQWKGVEIRRIPIIPRGKGSIGMIANYVSFVVSGWWWSMINDVKADLVFTFEVSPMTQALVGCWYKTRYRVPHFLYVQDLWPENVETVTGITNPVIIRPIDRMVDYIYGNADQIFTTSPSFAEAIVKRNVPVDKAKVHCWRQYAEDFYKARKRETVRRQADSDSPVHRIPDDDGFYIGFTGNIGAAQGLDILPKTARILRNFSRKIRFVIVGDGRYLERFTSDIRRLEVGDMFIMIPRQPSEVIPDILACCDAAFLSFQNTKLWEMTIPAKLQSYMACGMPVIAAAGGETEKIIEEAECGVCSPIGDCNALAESIKRIMGSDLKTMGANSRKYCEQRFNKEILMDEMEKRIKGLWK